MGSMPWHDSRHSPHFLPPFFNPECKRVTTCLGIRAVLRAENLDLFPARDYIVNVPRLSLEH